MKAIFGRLLCGVLGGGLVTATLPMSSAIALSESDLLEKFASVPVFVMTDSDDEYVIPQADWPNDGLGTVGLLQIFFEEESAKTLFQQLRDGNSRFNPGGSVGVTDLASIHRFAQRDRNTPLKVVFVPQADDLAAAMELDPNFGGNNAADIVPLFTIQDAAGNFIPLAFGNEEEVSFSMFFSNDDVNAVLADVNAAQPNLQARIRVFSFGALTRTMLNSDEEAFESIKFRQDSDVVNYLQELDLE